MFKQIFLPLIAVAVLIIVVGVFTRDPSVITKFNLGPKQTQDKSVTVGSKKVSVEIANTQALREKGLGGVSKLGEDSGMLFVFDSKNVTPVFWMKDMLIPLDIIWISGGKVVKIDQKIAAPAPGTPDGKLTVYPPGQAIDYVLEVNSGFSEKNKIKVGDSVTLPTL